MFWDLNSGTLEGRKGIFGNAGEQSNMTSVQWLSDGTAVTGAGNGQLYLWKDRQLQKTVQVNSGQILRRPRHSENASDRAFSQLAGKGLTSGPRHLTIQRFD